MTEVVGETPSDPTTLLQITPFSRGRLLWETPPQPPNHQTTPNHPNPSDALPASLTLVHFAKGCTSTFGANSWVVREATKS